MSELAFLAFYELIVNWVTSWAPCDSFGCQGQTIIDSS